MKTAVRLKKLTLENFKGTKNRVVEFEDETFIYGSNRSGKTTIFDAFTWLLFGKDSTDRKDFEIKTLDENNNVIEKTEVSVEGVLFVEDEEITLKRVLREKWVKQRGAFEATFTGNETLYYWNEVPMNQKEYMEKIANIINEDIFKLVSNPLAFNSLKWQDRRSVLTAIAGKTDINKLVSGDNELEKLLQLTEKKTIRELQAENSSKTKKIKDDLKLIPTRIDEVEKSKPESIDFKAIQEQLTVKRTELAEVENSLLDSSKANEVKLKKKQELQSEKFKKESEINNILNTFKVEAEAECKQDTTQIDALSRDIKTNNENINSYKNALKTLFISKSNLETDISGINSKMDELRESWTKENAKVLTFDENDFKCSCCDRAFENTDIESKKKELTEKFNENKLKFKEEINAKGIAFKSEIESKKIELSTIEKRIKKGNLEIEKLNKLGFELTVKLDLENANKEVKKDFKEVYDLKVSESKEIEVLKKEVAEIENLIKEPINLGNEQLLLSKKEILSKIEDLKKELSIEEQIKKANDRVAELVAEEKSLAKSLNELEKQQFTIERFIKLEIESLEHSINQKFKYVSFKMFETQINGSEIETCKTLIDGVPFSDANTASKINAGIDIINVLNKHYNVSAPIFIDNRESVTNLIETNSQVINLIVSEHDKTLRIE